MRSQKPQPCETDDRPLSPVLRQLALTDQEIRETFSLLRLCDDAQCAQFTSLRSLALGFHVVHHTWTSADSVTESNHKREI